VGFSCILVLNISKSGTGFSHLIFRVFHQNDVLLGPRAVFVNYMILYWPKGCFSCKCCVCKEMWCTSCVSKPNGTWRCDNVLFLTSHERLLIHTKIHNSMCMKVSYTNRSQKELESCEIRNILHNTTFERCVTFNPWLILVANFDEKMKAFWKICVL
jgi:hypothetical protein